MYSGRLNDAALQSLPYALLLHLMIGCWVYSAQYQVPHTYTLGVVAPVCVSSVKCQ